MDQKAMFSQIIDYSQVTFNSVFNATAMMQDQYAHAAKSVMDQATWLPDDGRQALENWMAAYKTSRDQYKKYMDDSYQKAHEYIAA